MDTFQDSVNLRERQKKAEKRQGKLKKLIMRQIISILQDKE